MNGKRYRCVTIKWLIGNINTGTNLQMESALKFKSYDFKFEKGAGTHSGKHGGAILPESLIWLWSDVNSK